MKADFFSGLFRNIFYFFDWIIYNFISLTYNIFMSITNVTMLSQNTINELAGRIYILLGIIMLFKVAFSLIQMFANPDSITGDKGLGKLVQKIIVMLILLVSVPTIFTFAYRVQNIILNQNIIGNIILGTNGQSGKSTEEKQEMMNNAGNTIAISVLNAFFYPVQDGVENLQAVNCSDGYPCFDSETATATYNGNYKYDYNFIVSTIAGGLTAWIILMFCFDVAIRSIKLAFLQLIAPIPIIASIDPKGQKTLDSWVQTCIKTYLDVFVRLIAIYFVIFVISEMGQEGGIFSFYTPGTSDLATGVNGLSGGLGKAFVVIGLLLFAKEVPKLIEDLLGIKLSGKFTLNPLKRISDVPMLGKGINTIASGIDSKTHGRGFWNGAKRGFKEAPLLGNDKGFSEARKYHNESVKNRIEGKDEVANRNKMDKDGNKFYHLQAQMKKDSDIYRNSDFRESYDAMGKEKKKMYAAKDLASAAQSEYSDALRRYGEGSAEAQKAFSRLGDANAAAGTAESRYEVAKAKHESIRKQNSDDAYKQDAIDYYKKTHDVEKKDDDQSNNTNTTSTTDTRKSTSSTSTSSNSSQSHAETVGGVNVSGSNSSGERTTPSGIILPGNINTDKH